MQTTVNERIKMLRTKLGLSQTDFAIKVGSSLMTVSRWETGATIPQKNIYRINQVFGVSLEWLNNGVGEMEVTTEQKASSSSKTEQVLESKIEHLEKEIMFYRDLLLNLSHKVAANFNEAFGLAGHEIVSIHKGKTIEMFAESVRVAS